MREQIVAQKVGNRSGIGKGRAGVGQRPAKRGSNEPMSARIKSLLGYVPLALRIGVIAIVITIMVLELTVPHGTSIEVLKPLIPVFLSYVLSFVYLGIYWNNHHHMLHAVKQV